MRHLLLPQGAEQFRQPIVLSRRQTFDHKDRVVSELNECLSIRSMKSSLVRARILAHRHLRIAFERSFRISLKELSGILDAVPFAHMNEQQLSGLRIFIEDGLITGPAFGRPLGFLLGNESAEDQKVSELTVDVGVDSLPI